MWDDDFREHDTPPLLHLIYTIFYIQLNRDANLKKIKIWEIASVTYFDPKKVVQSRDL